MMPKTMGVEKLEEGASPWPIIGPIECVSGLGQGTHNRVFPGLPGQLHKLRGLSNIRG